MRIIRFLTLAMMLTPILVTAQDEPGSGSSSVVRADGTWTQQVANAATKNLKPSSDEANRVISYYLNGKGQGPILLDAKICQGIKENGTERNECDRDITSQAIPKGRAVYLWMAYLVPFGEQTQSVVVLLEQGGVTRGVENLQVSSQLRNRAWVTLSLDRSGPWKLRVVRDTGSGAEPLGVVDVTVR